MSVPLGYSELIGFWMSRPWCTCTYRLGARNSCSVLKDCTMYTCQCQDGIQRLVYVEGCF